MELWADLIIWIALLLTAIWTFWITEMKFALFRGVISWKLFMRIFTILLIHLWNVHISSGFKLALIHSLVLLLFSTGRMPMFSFNNFTRQNLIQFNDWTSGYLARTRRVVMISTLDNLPLLCLWDLWITIVRKLVAFDFVFFPVIFLQSFLLIVSDCFWIWLLWFDCLVSGTDASQWSNTATRAVSASLIWVILDSWIVEVLSLAVITRCTIVGGSCVSGAWPGSPLLVARGGTTSIILLKFYLLYVDHRWAMIWWRSINLVD